MASKLSLTTRKNIKDVEPKLQAHLALITKATGITFEVEIDWLPLVDAVEKAGYKDRVGDIIYDYYIGGLSKNVETFCKDAIQKESFVEAFGSRHLIGFELHPSEPRVEGCESKYQWVTNKDGVLMIHTYEDKVCTNTSNTGQDLAQACSGDDALSVPTRKNIKDSEVKRAAHLKKILAATGIDFETEFDWVSVATSSANRGYKDRAGDVAHDFYLGGLTSKIEQFVKDPIQKEAFIESFGEKKLISLVIHGTAPEGFESAYNWVANDSGVLTIHTTDARFCSNASNTGDNLSKACSGDGPMNVATRKNIADTQKKLNDHLKKIVTACGIQFEVECDWPHVAEIVKLRGYENRAGDAINDYYVGGLAGNVVTFCKDPIQKEAFVECFGERKQIVFIIDREKNEQFANAYNYIVNNGGVLEIHAFHERMMSNAGNTGGGTDLAVACSGDGPLTVLARKNIADKLPERKKHLTRIQKATGVEYELEVDWATWSEAVAARGYKDRVGDIINNYLDGLASNLEKLCKDDMCKEAVTEATSKKVIAFSIVPAEQLGNAYQMCTFSEDGVLTVSTSIEKACTNTSNTGNDIQSRL